MIKYETFEEYYKRYPYKYTSTFSESEWRDHIYTIWNMKMKELIPTRLRRYIVTLSNGNSLPVQASDYMAAKLEVVRAYNIRITEIASVL